MDNLGGFKICAKRAINNYLQTSGTKADGKCEKLGYVPCGLSGFPAPDINWANVVCVPGDKLEDCPITSIAFKRNGEEYRMAVSDSNPFSASDY